MNSSDNSRFRYNHLVTAPSLPGRELHRVATPHYHYFPAMDDFEDDISELSSIASYPSSPGIFSQNPIELEDAINIPDINLESSRSQVSSSQSDYLVPPKTQNLLQ